MEWDNLFNSMSNAVEAKHQKIVKDVKRKVRGYNDTQLTNAYYSGNATAEGQEILEDEMRRRGLL